MKLLRGLWPARAPETLIYLPRFTLPGQMPLPKFLILEPNQRVILVELPNWEEAWEGLGLA